jgi:hypothetical protein
MMLLTSDVHVNRQKYCTLVFEPHSTGAGAAADHLSRVQDARVALGRCQVHTTRAQQFVEARARLRAGLNDLNDIVRALKRSLTCETHPVRCRLASARCMPSAKFHHARRQ